MNIFDHYSNRYERTREEEYSLQEYLDLCKQDRLAYASAAERMLELAAQQPGYLGAESTRGADGFGITVSYWVSEAAIVAWKHHAEHAATRAHGRTHWYEHFELRVAQVSRAYGKPAPSVKRPPQ